MNFPVATMVLGVLIFGWGLYWKLVPPKEGGTAAMASEPKSASQQIRQKTERGDNIGTQNNYYAPQPQQAARHPDSIYQMDGVVGTVQRVTPDLANSRFHFGAIVNAPNFDKSREFEYREYVLMYEGSHTEFVGNMAGMPVRTINNVTAKVIRKR